MDCSAKDFLDYIAHHPPKAFHGGCAKNALHPFLRNLQIIGLYHEYGRYDNWEKYKQDSDHDAPEAPAYTQFNKVPEAITIDPSKPHYPKLESEENTANNNYGINNNHRGPTEVKRRNIGVNGHVTMINVDTVSQETSSKQLSIEEKANLGTYQVNQGSDSPLDHVGNFLTRCTLGERESDGELITSLGYEIPEACQHPRETRKLNDCNQGKRSFLKAVFSDRVYSLLVVLLLWANFLRLVQFFIVDYGIPTMTKFIPVLWLALVAGTATAMFVSCVKTDHFYNFFVRWGVLFKDPTTRALGARGKLQTFYIKVVLIFQWVLSVINLASSCFIMLMEDDFSAGMNRLFYVTGYRSIPIYVISAVMLAISTLAWLGGVMFIVVCCHLLESHFWEFQQVLKLHISAAGMGFPHRLKLLRERYVAMCETVSVLDKFVCVYVAIFYSAKITLACVLLYQMVNVSMDASVMIVTIFWLSSSVILVAVVTYHLSNVNLAMHAITDDLYTIQTKNITLEESVQLQMFLAKGNGSSMGFTVLGMVVVTRELMLTLFGLYITYGLVLLQFQ